MSKLLIVLNEKPSFSMAENFELSEWEDSGFGDFLGFYDLLRDESHLPVGLRFWPFDDAAQALHSIPRSSTLRFEDEGKSLCVLFAEDVKWIEEKSGDQLMEESRLLFGADQTVALLFGLSSLVVQDAETVASVAASP